MRAAIWIFYSRKITQKTCLISHVRFFKKRFHENLLKMNIQNVMRLCMKMQLMFFHHLSKKEIKKTFRKIEFSSKYCSRPKFQKTRIKSQISFFSFFLMKKCFSVISFVLSTFLIFTLFVYFCFFYEIFVRSSNLSFFFFFDFLYWWTGFKIQKTVCSQFFSIMR